MHLLKKLMTCSIFNKKTLRCRGKKYKNREIARVFVQCILISLSVNERALVSFFDCT